MIYFCYTVNSLHKPDTTIYNTRLLKISQLMTYLMTSSKLHRVHIITTESCWSKSNVNTLSRHCRDDVYTWRG